MSTYCLRYSHLFFHDFLCRDVLFLEDKVLKLYICIQNILLALKKVTFTLYQMEFKSEHSSTFKVKTGCETH